MARNFKPNMPFSVPMKLLIPTYTVVKGSRVPTFPGPDDAPLIYGSFRTFGGTESTVNDVYTVIATGTIDTWYRPDIKADCQIYICATGETYKINGQPENIEMRNQYMQIRVEKIGGGA